MTYSECTYSKEYPLQHLAIVLGILCGVEPKFVFWVILLLEVQQNGGTLKDDKRVAIRIYKGRDSTIGV